MNELIFLGGYQENGVDMVFPPYASIAARRAVHRLLFLAAGNVWRASLLVGMIFLFTGPGATGCSLALLGLSLGTQATCATKDSYFWAEVSALAAVNCCWFFFTAKVILVDFCANGVLFSEALIDPGIALSVCGLNFWFTLRLLAEDKRHRSR